MASFGSRGFEIGYDETGGGPGLPLVILSGLGGTARGWSVVTVPDLSRSRRCIQVDLRGAGRSEDPGDPFTTRDLADDVLALFDHLRLERAHLLGAFLGGLVAQEVALAAQSRTASLVLVGAYAKLDAKRRMLLEIWKELAQYQLPAELQVRARLLWTLHEDTLEQRDLIEQMVRFFVRDGAPVDEKLFARQVDACLAHQSLPRLATLRVPTLVVAGEDDRLTPPRLTRELANAIPGARMVLMPGVGHLAMAEAAPRFNRLVERFLAEHD